MGFPSLKDWQNQVLDSNGELNITSPREYFEKCMKKTGKLNSNLASQNTSSRRASMASNASEDFFLSDSSDGMDMALTANMEQLGSPQILSNKTVNPADPGESEAMYISCISYITNRNYHSIRFVALKSIYGGHKAMNISETNLPIIRKITSSFTNMNNAQHALHHVAIDLAIDYLMFFMDPSVLAKEENAKIFLKFYQTEAGIRSLQSNGGDSIMPNDRLRLRETVVNAWAVPQVHMAELQEQV